MYQYSSHQIPCPGKPNPKGEDCIYIAQHDQRLCFCVFDGVGGWAKERGVDASEYSNKLGEGAKIAFEKLNLKSPLDILHASFKHATDVQGTRHDRYGEIVPLSAAPLSLHIAYVSTGCVALLEYRSGRSQPVLRVSNLGDSGVSLFRDYKQSFRTREQQVEFNMPFQMGTGSDIEPRSHSESSEVVLMRGDWLVMGSDGLFDNLDPSDIAKVLKKAFKVSQSKSAATPFGKEAKKYQMRWSGGKPDDISVIAVHIGGAAGKGRDLDESSEAASTSGKAKKKKK